jgi:hypothetical protein
MGDYTWYSLGMFQCLLGKGLFNQVNGSHGDLRKKLKFYIIRDQEGISNGQVLEVKRWRKVNMLLLTKVPGALPTGIDTN